LPFLRILRDKRGIEYLSLCQPGRDRRPRVLYWFRSSSVGKAGGRSPLDEATRREIERQFPDMTFDWQALWQTVTTAPLPELAAPTAKASGVEPPAAVAAVETSRGDRSTRDKPGRSGRGDRTGSGVEQRDTDQERVRARRNARGRRRPRSARRHAAIEVSPASEISE
jgi:hypothetical protein